MAPKKTQPALPPAPAELSDAARSMWDDTVAAYELSANELDILRNALCARDRAIQAGATVARDGMTTIDRYGGIRAHPAVDIEMRAQTLHARLVRQLGIDVVDGPAPRGRPGVSNGRR